MFQATLTGEVVVVQAAGPLTLPEDVRHVVLELGASDARAVLILEVSATGLLNANFLNKLTSRFH